MTTIAVAKKGAHVAIGADTLSKDNYTNVSDEYRVNDSKILRVNDNYIATTGFAGWNLILADYFDSLGDAPDLRSVRSIFATITALHESLKDDYHLDPHSDKGGSFESSHFDCLVANAHGIFGFFSRRNVIEYTKFYALGSGFQYALGAMRTIHDSAPSAEAIVRAGLEAGADFDENTSEPLEIYQLELASPNPS